MTTKHVWRPIETAPMDGTMVLLANLSPKDHSVLRAEEGCWEFIENSDWDGARVYDWTSTYGSMENPSHWMPLLRDVAE